MLGGTEIRKNQSTTRHMFKLGLATTKGKYKVMHVKTPQGTKSEPILTHYQKVEIS